MIALRRLRTSSCALIVLVAALTGIAGFCTAGASASELSYGPPLPGGGPPPGGFGNVITSLIVSPSGLVIGPRNRLAVVIPASTFPFAVQVTLTAPPLGRVHVRGYRPVAGVATQVQRSGRRLNGPFAKPLTATFRSSLITPTSIVQVWNGTRFVTDRAAIVARGSATVHYDGSSTFIVLART